MEGREEIEKNDEKGRIIDYECRLYFSGGRYSCFRSPKT